jgi:hypothetical protein
VGILVNCVCVVTSIDRNSWNKQDYFFPKLQLVSKHESSIFGNFEF